MNYREALAWLFGTQLFGIKLGLENITRLLGELRLPAPDQRVIHVAGTNGKGSVCAMVDAILRAAGYRTGLFTSPHLLTFRERIQVDGELISKDDVARGLTSLREHIKDWDPHPTFFEITTALALQHFKERESEIIVLETGMGGRLDATNAVQPVVSVITPIDYDHQKWLGNSLGEIAGEKAGIIKAGVPVVSARQQAAAEDVLRETARDRGSRLEFVSDEFVGKLALPGAHQKQNAALAIAAIKAARIEVSESAIKNGLTNVNWPARFQRVDSRITIDGAHNAAGARVLRRTWRDTFAAERGAIVLAILKDKNVPEIVRTLAPIASRFVVTRARSERAVPINELAQIVRNVAPDLPVTAAASFAEAMHATEHEPRVLITGSLHFAGEALAHLRGDLDDFDDCLQ